MSKQFSQNEVIDFFWEEYSNNYTGDLPYLRYEGPIPVFLYGSMSGYNRIHDFMKQHNLVENIDLHTETLMAVTQNPFVYFRNNSAKEAMKIYPDFMVHKDVEFEDLDMTKRKVRGKLVTMSLRGIMAMDRYYYNGSRFKRVRIPLQQDRNNKEFKHAYTYIVNPSTLTDNVKEQPFKVREGMSLKLPVTVSDSTTGELVYI